MLTYEIINTNLQEVKILDEDLICEELEGVFTDFQLTITQRTSLSTKKGSHHWHMKPHKKKGVLEVTYWPRKGMLWLEIANNRKADWNVVMIEEIANHLASKFTGEVRIEDN